MIITTAITSHDLGAISHLTPESISLNNSERSAYQPILWNSICSEYDSINFYNKISTQKVNYSKGFEQFLPGWLHDETAHTAGFKKIYNLTYGISESVIDKNLRTRVSDFSTIAEFLEDEFSTCLLLAFDEIVTTHVYERSMGFYRKVESTSLPKWIRKVKADEARHFINITKVIKNHHSGSKQSAEKILHRIVEIDAGLTDYNGTFVLDHSCPEFPLSKGNCTPLQISLPASAI